MNYKRFGRLDWQVSTIGYGMWGVAGGEGGWVGADDQTGMECLHKAVELGVNFFDTAWIYGRGHSEEMLGQLLRNIDPTQTPYIATKIPPKNREFPSQRGDSIEDIFPADHMEKYFERSLNFLGVDCIDLIQFHVWEDSWAQDTGWQKTIQDWQRQGLIRGVGLSINRWEPWNCLKTLETDLIDAVQVIYNIFDQSPEDELFQSCLERDIAVIARVPFDEGSLTGQLSKDSTWPDGDWRASYFVPENLIASVERADRLKPLVPNGWTLPEMALRFILHNPAVCTTIPGMRRLDHVISNTQVSDDKPFPTDLLQQLREHRWDRQPTAWSQ